MSQPRRRFVVLKMASPFSTFDWETIALRGEDAGSWKTLLIADKSESMA